MAHQTFSFFIFLQVVGSCISATTPNPYGYKIHQFDGNCHPDGTCTYTLTIPIKDALVNPNVMDNTTATSMINHLQIHDQQLEQLLNYFGHNTSTNQMNLPQEVQLIKQEETNLNNLVNILTDEVSKLLAENNLLKTQLTYVNRTILEKLTDPCLARPCAHNSKCTTINETSYDCDCPGGWGGIDCEIDINECAPGPNKADCGFGDCHNLPGSFLCDCHSGFTGPFCSINVDECASNPCLNGGVCKDGIDMYTCDCTNGFAGDHCEININECDSDPCLNGGICLDDVDDYYCVCNPGYTGKSCEQDIDECSNNPCVHGQCVNENGTFHCECDNLLIKGRLCEDAPSRDCGDLKAFWNLNKNSVYTVKKPGKQLTLARCDMNTDEGGWTVFQKRVDGVVNFDRKWDDYKTGFGNLGSSFWWGTERLYTVTAGRSNLTLRIDLEDFENNTAYAEYDNFSVGPESDNYRIHVGGYRGNAGDAFNFYWAAFSHNDMAFSTKDRDNDKFRTNCALLYHGGWWYNGCWSANLNGIYYDSPVYNATVHDGVEYYPWKQTKYSLKRVEMKFRDASIIQSNMTAPFV